MSLSVPEQVSLLKKCVAKDLDLDEELHRQGLSYDDLVYRKFERDAELFPAIPYSTVIQHIEDHRCDFNGIPTVSFFSGCGGLDIGFRYAGFKNVVALEKNPLFCKTLRKNNVSELVLGPPESTGDAKERDSIVERLTKAVGRSKDGFPGIFHGGPPCQSFSIAANQRFSKSDVNFKRIGFSHGDYGTLLFDYVFYIKTFRPVAFLVENVAGLLTVDDGDQISDAISELRGVGYNVADPVVINAADYGIPQNRMRTFIVGHRRNNHAFVFPAPARLKVPCGPIFQMPISTANSHVTRKHKAQSILRYMELDFGERDHLGRVDRLDPRLPSKTVIAGGSNGGGRSHLHPYIPRTLSVRECARLQTFPDTYAFSGTAARQFTQVGNAVPPLLAFQIAQEMKKQLFVSGSGGKQAFEYTIMEPKTQQTAALVRETRKRVPRR
jgi:DNA (cytosine-5)-methyltransferase 1